MKCRYLNAAEMRRALPVATTINALEWVMRDAAAGSTAAPLRTMCSVPRDGSARDSVFGVMPGAWNNRQAAGAKVVSYVPDNPAAGRPAVQGLAVLFDMATGEPRLIADGAALTTLRTGALVGLATKYLAPDMAPVVGIIGAGALAFDLIAGVAAVRAVERVMVVGRTPEKVEKFVGGLPWPAEAREDPNEVAAEADILITATSSLEPVVHSDSVRPGTHINAVGNFSPKGRELDGPTVAACERYVDDKEGALVEAGELVLAAEEGLIPAGEEGIVGDLPALVTGGVPGRTSPKQRTLFKSVGTALADVAGLATAADYAEIHELGRFLDPEEEQGAEKL